ncbi:hypothetical protein IQ266_14760 [filamentous cyanobacterium LEGE 11480]|uniref:DDE transposase family protein n=2 Tax=Romeriopsis TaxID=2992131 RepID=A0A928Z517_9CYAN|nr:hypothetical protein [Romeriopsis navalis LEGE 11480]
MNNLQSEETAWYIVQQGSGQCEIRPNSDPSAPPHLKQWGPYQSKAEAIAKRIGLIRAGKCQPM